MTNVNSLEQLVKLVARILALSEAGSEQAEKCLQCLHGPPHDHNSQSLTFADNDYKDTIIDHSNYCMVARLSRVALNTGLSCPSRHLASRSLQIHRALGGHLDKKSFSQLLARLGETVSDGSEEIQVIVLYGFCFGHHYDVLARTYLFRVIYTSEMYTTIIPNKVHNY